MIRKMSTCLTGAFCLGLLLNATPASAQGRRDREEVRKDRHEARDDRRDYQQIVDISEDWKRAVKNRNKRKEKSTDDRLVRWLQNEIRESKREAREAREDKSRREAYEKRKALREIRRIADDLMAMQGAFASGNANPKQYARKRALINQLVKAARDEMKEHGRYGNRHKAPLKKLHKVH